MANFTQLLGLQSGVQAVAQSGDAIDFTGLTLSGVTTTGLDDGTAQVALDNSGNLTTTGLVSWSIDPSGAFSFDGAAASNVTVASANLTVSTTTSGSLILTGAGLVDIDAGANLDIDVTGTWDVLASGAMSLDATGASNISVASGDLTLSTTTSGALLLNSAGLASIDAAGVVTIESSAAGITIGGDNVSQPIDIGTAGARTITVGNTTGATGLVVNVGTGNATVNLADDQGAAFALTNTGGGTNPLVVNTATKTIELDYSLTFNTTSGSTSINQDFGANATGAYVANSLLTIDPTTGKFSAFDCETDKSILGTAIIAADDANDPVIAAVGGIIKAVFDSAPAAASIGQFVYALGATGSNQGKVGLTAPTASGSRVFKVGVLLAANGSLTTTTIAWQPQFLYDVP
jgi:hypothetical protein